MQGEGPILILLDSHTAIPHACCVPPLLSQTLEKERDSAEDRLKIEQTQRDSVEKLRRRNKELEDQLRALCESQVRGAGGS